MSESTKPRDHYAALDGLRGFAALSVVLFHIGHWFNLPGFATNGSLAVDLFFCLSGYVLPLAYEKRLQSGLSTFQFTRIRLIRLMPLIALGIVISASYVLFRSVVKGSISYQELALATVLGIINIPFLTASAAIGGPQVFPLNGPQYSLFFEIFVNIVWAGVRGFERLWLYVFLFVICFVTVWTVGLGGDEAATFWTGFPHVGAAFFAGVILFHLDKRFGGHRELRLLFWVMMVVMVALFYYPEELSLSVQLVWLAVLSPLLIYAASKIKLSGKLRSLALLGGELSYPIYALHYPIFCWINGAYQAVTKQQNVMIEGPLVVAGVLAGSYLALKIYDLPLRSWASSATRVRSQRLAPR